MAGACGDCVLCCKLFGIVELSKPKDAWCPHCDLKSKGCKIYESRPPSCHNFECLWLQTQGTPKALSLRFRPDKVKMFLWQDEHNENLMVAHVDPAYPLAWKAGPMLEVLHLIPEHMTVLIGASTRFWAIKGGHYREITMTEPDENGVKLIKEYLSEPERLPNP